MGAGKEALCSEDKREAVDQGPGHGAELLHSRSQVRSDALLALAAEDKCHHPFPPLPTFSAVRYPMGPPTIRDVTTEKLVSRGIFS